MTVSINLNNNNNINNKKKLLYCMTHLRFFSAFKECPDGDVNVFHLGFYYPFFCIGNCKADHFCVKFDVYNS